MKLYLSPLLLLLAAAAPMSGTASPPGMQTAFATGALVAEPPGERGGDAYAPAPMPDRDVAEPAAAAASGDAQLQPSVFSRKTEFQGDGFSPGSTVQSSEGRNLHPGWGLNWKMPVQ